MRKLIVMLAGTSAIAGLSLTAMAEMVDGEVTKINEAAEKMTIKHGPLKEFGMEDPMTMVFRVKDPAMLKQVKPGDKIKFEPDKVNGRFTVMKLEKAKK